MFYDAMLLVKIFTNDYVRFLQYLPKYCIIRSVMNVISSMHLNNFLTAFICISMFLLWYWNIIFETCEVLTLRSWPAWPVAGTCSTIPCSRPSRPQLLVWCSLRTLRRTLQGKCKGAACGTRDRRGNRGQFPGNHHTAILWNVT